MAIRHGIGVRVAADDPAAVVDAKDRRAEAPAVITASAATATAAARDKRKQRRTRCGGAIRIPFGELGPRAWSTGRQGLDIMIGICMGLS